MKKINFSDLKIAAKQVQRVTNTMSMDKITILREQVKEVINLKIRIDLLEKNSLDLDNMDCQHKSMNKRMLTNS